MNFNFEYDLMTSFLKIYNSKLHVQSNQKRYAFQLNSWFDKT
jgi:hypothetical protein